MSVDKNIEAKQHHLIPCSSIEQINQQPPLSVSHASKPSKHTESTQYQYLLFTLSPVAGSTAHMHVWTHLTLSSLSHIARSRTAGGSSSNNSHSLSLTSLSYSSCLTLSPSVGKGPKEAAAGSSIPPCSNLSLPPCALIFLHQVVQQQQLPPFSSSSNFLDHRNHQGCFSTRFPYLDFSTARTSRHQLLSFCLLLQSTLPNNSLLHLLLW